MRLLLYGLIGLMGVAAGWLLLWWPALGVVTVLVCTGLVAGLAYPNRLPYVAAGALGVTLAGYAFLGRGFAHLGSFPFYIGEAVLFLSVLAFFVSASLGTVLSSRLKLLILLFMAWGVVCTVPHLADYGAEAFRDAALWGYAMFALAFSVLFVRTGIVRQIPTWYARLAAWLLVWTPFAFLVQRFAGDQIPLIPGTEVPILALKGGDMAVHLVGIAAFLILGLDQYYRPLSRGTRMAAWPLWGIAATLLISSGRSALLTLAIGTLLVVMIRPARSGWIRPAAVGFFMISLLFLSDFRISLGGERELGADQIVENVASLVGTSESEALEGTRSWRLLWWSAIVDYTVFGEHFWTGKGYGVNLAADDGFEVGEEGLRSPHNGHLTILARSGVPGLGLWIILQLSFAAAMLMAYFRAQRAGYEVWARIDLWILAYWAAFMVNSAFDVFLEGPQGGIWFWTLIGYAMAALEMQRRDMAQIGHEEESEVAAAPHSVERALLSRV